MKTWFYGNYGTFYFLKWLYGRKGKKNSVNISYRCVEQENSKEFWSSEILFLEGEGLYYFGLYKFELKLLYKLNEAS